MHKSLKYNSNTQRNGILVEFCPFAQSNRDFNQPKPSSNALFHDNSSRLLAFREGPKASSTCKMSLFLICDRFIVFEWKCGPVG